VVAADHPQRPVVLQDAAAFLQPGLGEGVVALEALEVIPVVVDRVDLGIVWTQEVAAELQLYGGSANTRSTDRSGSFFSSSRQSP
jgi:hypothetical protein